MPDPAVTKEQLHILQHSIKGQPKSKCYRNYYCASFGNPDCEALFNMGLMEKGMVINDGKAQYYRVSDAGFKFLELDH